MRTFSFRTLAAVLSSSVLACSPTLESSCKSDEDCAPGERCAALHCVAGSAAGADADPGGASGFGGANGRTDASAGGTPAIDAAARADLGGPADARAPDAATSGLPDMHVNLKPDADRSDGGAGGGGSGGTGGSAGGSGGSGGVGGHGAGGGSGGIGGSGGSGGAMPPDASVSPTPDAGPMCIEDNEVCDGLDNDCNAVVDDIAATCTAGEGYCVAPGAMRCRADGTMRCLAVPGPPQAERCDGIDNDCDGRVDDNLVIDCYDGLAGTRDVGICRGGTRRCADPDPGLYGACGGQQLPVDETCNGVDDDCDGTVDNLPLGPECYEGVPDELLVPNTACQSGRETCVSGQIACIGQVLPVVGDDCNGVDDDCDGDIDQDCACQPGAQCAGADIGICRPGVQLCNGDVLLECDGRVEPAALDACNGLDDDCDGEIDEDGDVSCYPVRLGTENTGVCRLGVQACRNGVVDPVCVGAVAPTDELCNGLDDDCDASTDEDFPELGAPCVEGVGTCQRSGFLACAADGAQTVCPVTLGVPSIEVCNGQDDDCDGAPDDGADLSCYDGAEGTAGIGTCVAGVRACQNGALGACIGQVTPQVERCDALRVDENCDGQVDEGCDCIDGESVPCGSDVGACIAGIQTCTDGRFGECLGGTAPQPEICNLEDDDCNGDVDDVPAAVCYTGAAGTAGVGQCVSGRAACKQGQDACAGEVLPSDEVCDGLDNDCDGRIDNDADPGGECDTGQRGACAAGVRKCVGGGVVCQQQVQSRAEVCNGIDDDCDGQADEPPILTRAEYDIDQTGKTGARPSLASTDAGFLAVFSSSAGQAQPALRGRGLNPAGDPLPGVFTALNRGAGLVGPRTMRVVSLPAASAAPDRRYLAAWSDNAVVRYRALGDDGLAHNLAEQSFSSVEGYTPTLFDAATAPGGILFGWLEATAVAQRVRLAVMTEAGQSVVAPQLIDFGVVVRNAVAVAVHVNNNNVARYAIAWSEGTEVAGAVRLAVSDGVNPPTYREVAASGRLGGITEAQGGFAITWTSAVNNTIWVRRYDRDANPTGPAIAVSESRQQRTGLSINALSDNGLGILFREGDGIYYHRLSAAGTIHPQRARIGSWGNTGVDPVLRRAGTAALWVYGAQNDGVNVSAARMALGEFLCAPSP